MTAGSGSRQRLGAPTTDGTAVAAGDPRPRRAVVLAAGQVRYQLLLLLRNPLGFFLALVIPLLLLVSLNLLTPGTVATAAPGTRYAQFLTPAIGTFCLLNACYVNTVTGLVLAREQGILKRVRGTPIPAWTYLAGRFGAALATAASALVILAGVGIVFFHVTLRAAALGHVAAVAGLGATCFFLLGVAVSTLVPTGDTALPVAYGTLLPLAFISDVFFSSAHAPRWLHDLASAFPVAPVARALETAFASGGRGWPMPASGLLCLACWSAGAVAVTALAFRWEPGPPRLPYPVIPRR